MELLCSLIVICAVALTFRIVYKELFCSHMQYRASKSKESYRNVIDINYLAECRALEISPKVHGVNSLASQTILLRRRDRLLDKAGDK
ncbi:hypothetical protein N482_13150 [Pseudoalteromonas luteoviolacea NCIMB 1942]|uniref:Uncharacterized protein n=1 Tax=Pseudoalteromonas luteoviolacea NCIMB 1942 TaxID=1365253 RepID=A0A167B0F0_9GAMM|nr:hypothetical protein N482_13150 [Pseudoalteromonas luteoviolacea NCIMB 1942]